MRCHIRLLAAFAAVAFSSFLTGCGAGSTNKKSSLEAKDPVSANALSDVFEVIDFSPDGELPSEVRNPSISVQFSEPVVALQSLGEQSDKSPYVTIDPPIKGVFRWYGTSLLSFECSEAAIPQKKYTVKIAPDMVSVSGKTISGKLEYSFHTEELKMKSVVPGYTAISEGKYVDFESVPLELAKDIGLKFNSPVNPDVIKKYLTVTSYDPVTDNPISLPYKAALGTVTGDKKNTSLLRITLLETPPEDSDIELTLPFGSMADDDCVPTTERQCLVFHTLTPFKLRNVDYESSSYSEYSNPVQFIFSHILLAGQESKVASLVSTNPKMKITKDNIAIKGSRVIVHGLPVAYDSTYEMTLASGVKDIYGRTSESVTKNIKVPKAASFVRYKDYGFKMLEAQYTPRTVFSFQNVKSGSKYGVAGIADANGDATNGSISWTDLYGKYPDDTKIIQTVDLAPYLEKTAGGQYRGSVRVDSDVYYEYRYRDWRTEQMTSKITNDSNYNVIQVTDLGLTVRYGYNQAAVLVTKLSTGEPVANAAVNAYMVSDMSRKDFQVRFLADTSSYNKVGSSTTDSNGFAVINLRNGTFGSNGLIYIEAKTDDDRAVFNPDSHNMWRSSISSVRSPSYAEKLRRVAFIFTDRGLYKPGETVTFRGIDRNLQLGKYSPFYGSYEINLQDTGWDSTVYATQKEKTTRNGTFWGRFKIPEDLEPGTYELEYKRDGEVVESCYIQVQFFEKLRFEASTSIPKITYYSGDTLSANLSANYLGGGSMGSCSYSTYWSRTPCGFTLPGDKFRGMRFGPIQGYDGYTSLENEEGRLSAEGKASLSQKSGGENLKGMAYSYKVNSTVVDSGNQSIATTASTVVHPARFYIGLGKIKNLKGFPKKGQNLSFDYICVTPEGEAPEKSMLPSSGKMHIELLREEWKEVQQISWDGSLTSRYQRTMVTESEKDVALSGSLKPTEISVTPPKGGAYIVRLTTQDALGNDIVTESRFYATSSDWYWFDRDSAEEITLTTDKDEYEVGERAQILMQSPLPKGTYMITVEREGIVNSEVRTITEPTSVLEFDIKESYVPVMYVAVSSYSTRTEPPAADYNSIDIGKPKGYFGVTALNVSTATRRFDIEIKTDKTLYRPGEKATISVHASTKSGPVQNAEITLMAVDRGVIDLINYHVADPVSYFYDKWLFPECVRGGDSRSLLMDPVTYSTSNLVGGDADKLNERKNFEPTALFEPQLITDANGNAKCTFTLPDSLTAYRITAVGVDENNFSIAEDEMPVANPVSVRTVLPRQLRLNDQSEIGVTISNIESKSHKVTVSMQVYPGIEKTGAVQSEDEVQKLPGKASIVQEASKSITVPADTTSPLMFQIKAESQGWVTVEYTVKSDVVNEKILMPLQIEKPYIYETVATVGQIDADSGKNGEAQEKIVIPGSADDGKGSLYVQLDPTRLGVLREAVTYLFHYPYGCLEQRSSAILPLVAFGEYVDLFGLNNEVKNPKKVVEKEIKTWASSQLSSGAFPYWPGGSYDSPYVSTRIAEILGIAKSKNYRGVESINTSDLVKYLENHAYSMLSDADEFSWRDYDAAHELYAASTLSGDIDESYVDRIVAKDDADVNTLALCGLIYCNTGNKAKAKDALKKAGRYVSLTTRGADITDASFSGYWSFYSDTSEKFALMLQLQSRLDSKASISQHLVYELLMLQKAHRGYWRSTAATSRVLVALDEYIRANNLTKLNFSAEVLLNGTSLAKGDFKGVEAKPVDATFDFTESPMKNMPRDKEIALDFKKNGTGTLFYTAAMKYAVPPSEQAARDEGICIFTEITDVKTGQVVSGNELVSGNVYREVVYVSTPRSREYVAVRAPIPAGAEILNAAFVTTGTLPESSGSDDYDDDDWASWYENYNWGLSYQGIYDSEVQYFWDYFPRGHQTVEFMFRAARTGTFNTPCPTAECMYQEEIFGRGNGKVWTIK
ncbi:MAG TPA: hypothetical protein DEO40_00250 [Treponema sp.]|nr:hypothetical protein [Treponema sp.]